MIKLVKTYDALTDASMTNWSSSVHYRYAKPYKA